MNMRLLHTGTADYEAMTWLRYRVLLQPIGVPRSYINPQKEAGDILIGAFEGDALAGCCILTPVNKHTVQLRQMAVDSRLQKRASAQPLLPLPRTRPAKKATQPLC